MRMYKSAIALCVSFIFANSANAADSFTFTGNGYGHGVGLSQIGGKAMALDGKSAEEILKYYYTGVNVEPLSDWYEVRINIGHELTSATLQLVSNSGFLKINDYQIKERGVIAYFRYSSAGIVTIIRKQKTTLATLPATNSISIHWSGT
ncbi:MAG: hypothetical protein ACKN92_07345, partial [Candidatus Nanopelagicaceae bacterium]